MSETRRTYVPPAADPLDAFTRGYLTLSDRFDRMVLALRYAETELSEYEETGQIAPVSLAATLRMVRAALVATKSDPGRCERPGPASGTCRGGSGHGF